MSTHDLYTRIHAVLTAAQAERPQRQKWLGTEPEWAWAERDTMWTEVNAARAEAGLTSVHLTAILDAEQPTMGHSDYTMKYALCCAELAQEPS